ncbi:acetyl-CoA C-acetyltransferase [Sphingobium sp. V4]|uniref:acetyl-CoA C-acetyltransferase n=1 Tax=Sphingobium sp. V4 TaxID=3038927 RepID=UPI0025581FF9|nr:acetyl-CoA C-acetyltransferase [Sphingobium sp. V4]WIW89532.1 acetyl-CoA C-acetyltransferase [Sphingobium sp. V4]
MPEALIIDAVRTPRGIGKPGKGALSHLHPQVLGATVLKELVARNPVDPAKIDDVIFGTAIQKWKQGSDIARMSALFAGLPDTVSGVTLDRFCGAGITSTALASASIMSGMEDCLIAGGVEMMSYHLEIGAIEAEKGIPRLGMSAGNAALQALRPQAQQGVCADAIAAIEGITREDADAVGLESQKRADIAIREGRFDKSLVTVYNEDGSVALARDEFPRPQTTAEGLAALKPSFQEWADRVAGPDGQTYRQIIQSKYPGLAFEAIHHAGNSSGVVDGAAAILLASPEFAQSNGLKPRAKIVAYANIGDCPTLMLNAPVPAARKVLAKAGLTVDDIDLFEINEAFAVVAEKFVRDLKLDRDKVNVNGGACALGHPIGATGAILIGTVLDELERRDLRRGLVTMCAAGGMAPAIIIERV